jgi:4-carboxymuconolactone decarboxylase
MLGRSVGLSDEEMAGMAEPESVASFDDVDRLVLRYAETSIRDIKIPDELYAKLAERFPKDQLIELCMTVALAALVNRVHATFQTDLDDSTKQSVADGPACPIGK